MSRHGENIRKRQDGRWEGRYPVYNEEKRKTVYRSVYGRTYDEAKEKLTTQKNLTGQNACTFQKNIRLKTTNAAENITLFDVAEDWLLEVSVKRKRSTYVKYRAIYRNYIEPQLGGLRLSEMTDCLAANRISCELSDSIRKSIYCVINQILKYSTKKYGLAMPTLQKPASSIRSKPVEALSRIEQKRLISTLYHDMDLYKMAIMLCLFTGLRLGELCALKWSDIDFENKILTVNRTVQRLSVEGCNTKTRLVETAPKSEYSRREIPLSAVILELLIRFQSNNDYVFGKNCPMEPRTLQNRFKKILQEANLANKKFHILRHTFSTNCIEGGTDVKSLSEMLGHSDVQITLNRYVHPSIQLKRKHINILSRFYGQIYGQPNWGNTESVTAEAEFS